MPQSVLKKRTVGEVRAHPFAIRGIARLTGLEAEQVEVRLKKLADGVLLATAFKRELRRVEGIADLTVAFVRKHGMEADVAEAGDRSVSTVRGKLRDCGGGDRMRNCFEFWSESFFLDEKDPSAERDALACLSEGERPTEILGGMGRHEHRLLQDRLRKIGELRNLHVRSDFDIGGGFRPDVLWFGLDPKTEPRAAPQHVFEIEFGSSTPIAKSLASLKHAHDLWPNTRLMMLAPRRNHPVVEKKMPGAFHEISGAMTLLAIEDCLGCGENLHELARLVGVVGGAGAPSKTKRRGGRAP